jgi:hypothetical protein
MAYTGGLGAYCNMHPTLVMLGAGHASMRGAGYTSMRGSIPGVTLLKLQRTPAWQVFMLYYSGTACCCRFLLFGGAMQWLAQRSWGRRLLLAFPKLFSFGMFSHEGPSEQQMRDTVFMMTNIGHGYSKGEAAAVRDRPAQRSSSSRGQELTCAAASVRWNRSDQPQSPVAKIQGCHQRDKGVVGPGLRTGTECNCLMAAVPTIVPSRLEMQWTVGVLCMQLTAGSPMQDVPALPHPPAGAPSTPDEQPDMEVTTRVSGPEPGYLACSIFIVQVSY